jgi:predicted nucleic-acid-binding Zn-ribbon protein
VAMWQRDRAAVDDDMKEEWQCPKCWGKEYELRYCIAMCREQPFLDSGGRYFPKQGWSDSNPMYEHLHLTCTTCGFETLENCRDKVGRARTPEPSQSIEP